MAVQDHATLLAELTSAAQRAGKVRAAVAEASQALAAMPSTPPTASVTTVPGLAASPSQMKR